MASKAPPQQKKSPASGGGGVVGPSTGTPSSDAQQLRAELTKVTALLQETDEALDEWIAECEKLQKTIASKETENTTLRQQIDELRLHVIKLSEGGGGSTTTTTSGAKRTTTTPLAAGGKAAGDEVLREQLKQAQQWVKESQAKAEAEANRAKAAIKERDELMSKTNTGEAVRLANVAHAQELELKALRAKVVALNDAIREANLELGKVQFFATVLSYQVELAREEDFTISSMLRSVLQWSSRL